MSDNTNDRRSEREGVVKELNDTAAEHHIPKLKVRATNDEVHALFQKLAVTVSQAKNKRAPP